MSRYHREDLVPGVFITLDGGPCIEATRPKPTPIRYGDPLPDLSAVHANLDEVGARIEKLRAALRARGKH